MSLIRTISIAIRGALVLSPFVIHLITADLLLSLLLPLSFVAPSIAYNLCSRIAGLVWAHIQLMFEMINQAQISYSRLSSNLPREESAIIIANHISWTDFYMIQSLAQKLGMLGRCRWFAKSQLRWVPLLGWGLWAMGMPLVTREWTHDREEMERVFGGIRDKRWPIWLIAYSEATRFTAKKHAETVKWCKEKGKRVPKHTLYPRHRGFVNTVQQLRKAPHVKAVYDVTIAYAGLKGTKWQFMAAPTMWESISLSNLGDTYKFQVKVDRFPIEDLPHSDDDLKTWIENRWVEKDAELEGMRMELQEGFWGGEMLSLNN